MPATLTPNGKPAEETILGGLNLVWTTTLPLRKDSTNDLYYITRAPSRPH